MPLPLCFNRAVALNFRGRQALCEKAHVDELKHLTDDVTDTCNGASLESLDDINTHSADELSECQANAAATFERVLGYISRHLSLFDHKRYT